VFAQQSLQHKLSQSCYDSVYKLCRTTWSWRVHRTESVSLMGHMWSETARSIGPTRNGKTTSSISHRFFLQYEEVTVLLKHIELFMYCAGFYWTLQLFQRHVHGTKYTYAVHRYVITLNMHMSRYVHTFNTYGPPAMLFHCTHTEILHWIRH